MKATNASTHLKGLSEDIETDDNFDKAIMSEPKLRRSTLTSEDSVASYNKATTSESIFSGTSAAVNPHRAIPLESNPPAVKSTPSRVNSVPHPTKTRGSVAHKDGVKNPQGTKVDMRKRATVIPNARPSLPAKRQSRSKTCTIM